jgi:hypothetical protein
MVRRMKMAVASLAAGGTLLVGGFAGPAEAANQDQGDALVNVQIGDITVQDVNVAVAADIIVQACDLVDANAALLLVQDVDQTNKSQTVCKTDSGPVRIRQN